MLYATAAAKSLQSFWTLCNPIEDSPPGSAIPGILQARTLEWVAISFSSAWKWKVKVKSLSRVRLFATSWTAAYQAPPSMEFSRQEYWSGVPLPSLKCCIGAVKFHFTNHSRKNCRTSLVVQWLAICLPMPGTWVWSLIWEDSTCLGTTEHVCHSPEPARCEPVLCNEKPPQWEAGVLQLQKPKQQRPRVTNNK